MERLRQSMPVTLWSTTPCAIFKLDNLSLLLRTVRRCAEIIRSEITAWTHMRPVRLALVPDGMAALMAVLAPCWLSLGVSRVPTGARYIEQQGAVVLL